MQPPPIAPGPRSVESILVHGTDVRGIHALAAGLALRTSRSFAWADCADPRSEVGYATRSWLEERSGEPVVDVVDASLLRPGNLNRAMLRHLIAPACASDETRLLNHLSLPELYQRLAARAISPDGRGTIVLANVDALLPALRASTVETVHLHTTLHEEGLTLIASSRASPSEAMVRAFDRIFRVEVPAGAGLTSGWLTEEKAAGREITGGAMLFRTAWDQLGLDPALLADR